MQQDLQHAIWTVVIVQSLDNIGHLMVVLKHQMTCYIMQIIKLKEEKYKFYHISHEQLGAYFKNMSRRCSANELHLALLSSRGHSWFLCSFEFDP
jgi:hypothetical protein